MGYIYVNQINFEHPLSGSLHDLPQNSGTNIPSLAEAIVTPSHIYVNIVNLEIPVGELNADVVVCTQLATHTIEEVIEGTPVVEPEVAVGGGAGQRIRVLGGLPWSKEKVVTSAVAQHFIGEEIFVNETVEAYSYNTSDLETKIRRPIYKQPRKVEIMHFTPTSERTVIIPIEVPEAPKINLREREEEELLLLGII